MSSSDDSSTGRRGAQELRLAPSIEAFEAAWNGDDPPAIEEFLQQASEEDRAALLRALLEIELERRRRRGEEPRAEDYLSRFSAADAPLIHSEFDKTCGWAASDRRPEASGEPDSREDPNHADGEFPLAIPGYRLKQLLGQGGMGKVYLADDLQLGREVVVKTIRPELLTDSRHRQRFIMEAQAAAQVKSDHVVEVFGSGEAIARDADGERGAVPYMVMEYVRGRTLVDLFPREKPEEENAGKASPTPVPILPVLDDKTAAEYVMQAAKGLSDVHERGIIHRDVKPSNIFLDDASNRVLIGDFGLAKLEQQEEDLTETGAMLGTRLYMSPEQFEDSKNVTQRADVYGLGATLYFLLCGQTPFSSPSDLVKPGKVPPSPNQARDAFFSNNKSPHRDGARRKRPPKVSPDLQFICMRCLEKDPAQRYASAAQVAERLQRFLDNKPIPERPVGVHAPLYYTGKWCRRHPLGATFVAVVSLLLVVLASVLAVSNYRITSVNEQLATTNGDLEHANTELEKKTEETLKANQQLETANRDLEAKTREATRRLAEQFERNTEQSWSQSNYQQSAVWSAAALRVEQEDQQHAPLHRRRILNALRQIAKPENVLFHDEPVTFAEFGFRGEQVLTAAGSRVRIWSRETGKLLRELPDQEASVTSARFHPASRALLLTAGDTARFYEADAEQPTAELRRPGEVFGLASFSPSGEKALFVTNDAQGDSKALVWSLSEGTLVDCDPQEFITSIDISPEGGRLVLVVGNDAQLWDAATGEPIMQQAKDGESTPLRFSHPARIAAAAFSHDGARLATAGDDGLVHLWNIANQQQAWPQPFNMGGAVGSVAFSPDDMHVYANSGRNQQLVDAASGAAMPIGHFPAMLIAYRTFIGVRQETPDLEHYLEVAADQSVRIYNAAGFSPDAMHLIATKPITAAWESSGGKYIVAPCPGDRPDEQDFNIWNSETGKRRVIVLAGVAALTFSPDNESSATLQYGQLSVFEPKSEKEPTQLGEHSWAVALTYSPDGESLLLWGDAKAALVSAEDGSVQKEFLTPDELVVSATLDPKSLRLLTWSLPGATVEAFRQVPRERQMQFLFTTASDVRGTWRLWDATTGEVIAQLQDVLLGPAKFSPNGEYVFAPCAASFVRFWDAETGAIKAEFNHPYVSMASINPDNTRLVTAGGNGGIQLIDTSTSNGQVLLADDFGAPPVAVDFSPDGGEFVVAGGTAVQVYQAESGKRLSPPLQHPSAVTIVKFLQDGRRVMTTSPNEHGVGVIRLWDVADDDDWSSTELADAAELIGGAVEQQGNLVTLTREAAESTWRMLQQKRPEMSSPAPSQNIAYHYQQSVNRSQNKDWHRAVQHLTHLLQPSLTLPKELRGAYLRSRAEYYIQQQRLTKADDDLDAALELVPSDPFAWALVAHLRVLQRRWKDAIDASTAAIDRQWSDAAAQRYGGASKWRAWAWELRARAYAELEQWADAESDLRTAAAQFSLPDLALMPNESVTAELKLTRELALCLARQDKAEELQELQGTCIDRFAGTTNPDAASTVLRIVTLRDLAWVSHDRLAALYTLQQQCENVSRLYTLGQVHFAILAFRTRAPGNSTVGRNLQSVIDAENWSDTPREWLMLAMHRHYRAEATEAQELLAKSEKWITEAKKLRESGAEDAEHWSDLLEYQLLLEEAAAYVGEHPSIVKLEKRIQGLEKAVQDNPDDRAKQRDLALARAELGVLDADQADWRREAEAFSTLIEGERADVELWYYLALSQLADGDHDTYEKTCRDMVQHFLTDADKASKTVIAKTTLSTISLAPNSASRAFGDLPEANQAELRDRAALQFVFAIFRGAMKAQSTSSMAKHQQQLEAIARSPFELLFVAIVAARLGDLESDELAEKAQTAAKAALQSPVEKWYRKLEIQLLHQELEELR
ncbi:MAG: protein kinase [Pirellulaceae bacterium]